MTMMTMISQLPILPTSLSSILLLLLSTAIIPLLLLYLLPKHSTTTPFPSFVALVIAHPDDESLFFSPALIYWPPEKRIVVCLSNGGFDGLGDIRTRELAGAMDVMGGAGKIVIGDFQDGPEAVWEENRVARFIQDVLSEFSNESITLLTFDGRGVSGHANHIAAYRGALRYHADLNPQATLCSLMSPAWWIKYTGPVGALLSYYIKPLNQFAFINTNPLVTVRAMRAHGSQFVWYRKLFVVFYVGTYVNIFIQQ